MPRSVLVELGRAPAAPAPELWATNGLPLGGQILFGSCGTNYPTDTGAEYAEAAIAQVEAKWGGSPGVGVHRMYFGSTDTPTTAANAASNAHAHGRIPWQSFKLPFTWASGASGGGDSWATAMAAALGALDGPVWVMLHHEPEGDGVIADWRNMQARLMPIFKAYDNIATGICVTGYSQVTDAAGLGWNDMWPTNGHLFLDIYACDPYNYYKSISNPTGNFVEVVNVYQSDWLLWKNADPARANVRFSVGEFGLNAAASQTPEDYYDPVLGKVVATEGPGWEYIQRQYAKMGELGSAAVLCYYDYSMTNNWQLDSDEKKADAGAVAAIAPRYPF